MSPRVFTPLRWLTIDYSPHPAERPFVERAQTRREREVETTVAVPSDRESGPAGSPRVAGCLVGSSERRRGTAMAGPRPT
jgi:hypothetical protein